MKLIFTVWLIVLLSKIEGFRYPSQFCVWSNSRPIQTMERQRTLAEEYLKLHPNMIHDLHSKLNEMELLDKDIKKGIRKGL